MKKLFFNTILEATKGIAIQKCHEDFFGVSTDSRTIKQNQLFIPLSGENFNGHKFITTAIANGATGVLVNKNENYEKVEGITFIEVENTLKAYQNIGSFFRTQINPFVIGITGSSGKTSTKEICYAFMKQFFNTFKSEANFNNEIGVPQNLINLKEENKVAIIEMGMRGRNQIVELCEIAQPNVGIITGVGSAHIEILGSKNEIALAKWELAQYLKENNAFLAIPAYDSYLVELSKNFASNKLLKINLEDDSESLLVLKKHWLEDDKQYFIFKDNETNKEHKAVLSVLGKHQISNALLVLAIGKVLKVTYPEFIDLTFENLAGRSESVQIDSALFLNDAYNANPESMKAAIETFLAQNNELPKFLVIGEMRELGIHAQEAHYDIGKFCSNFNFEELIVVGNNAIEIKKGFDDNSEKKATFVSSNKEASEYLKNIITKKVNILLKASRGAKLEEILTALKEKNLKI